MKNNPLVYDKLHETALNAPKLPGVYLWKDENQQVIYVGKAKILKNRLSSYFSGKKDIKTKTLRSKATSIEYITTDNEYEALILENTLIKKYSPKYNINLKDDKSYPCLKVTKEDFPRIYSTRRIVEDGSKYFGPYPNATSLALYIENLHKQYKLRHCKKFQKRKSPCMYYHIGRCSAPCCSKINKQSYNEIIDEILLFLEGNPEQTIENLKLKMKEEAKLLNFEKAARIRDGIEAIKNLHTKNNVMDFNTDERDYIGMASDGTMTSFAILKMRDGRLITKDIRRVKSFTEDDEILMEFLLAYYTRKENFPKQIFIPLKIDENLFEKYCKENFKISPKLIFIENVNQIEKNDKSEKSSEKISTLNKSAMKMAYQNAYEDILRRIRERSDIPGLQELQKIMKMDHLPVRIEGFDIAHIGGNLPVASLISFYNGNPDKKNYRYFRLKTTDGVIDDFASMREATARRYSRLLNENKPLPDLIMIDGGIGQVNAVKGVLDALGLEIPIVGLAEHYEDLYFPGNSTPLVLPRRSDALKLLQRVRDECHRFATSKNQQLRTKSNTTGDFPKLPHVGSKRSAILMANYGTLENLVLSCEKEGLERLSELICVTSENATEIFQAANILIKEDF